jgi:glutamine synthetase
VLAKQQRFRVFDATANIYLVAALIWAGLDGIRRNLTAPPDVPADPDTLSASDRKRMNIRVLPKNLETAIKAAESDKDCSTVSAASHRCLARGKDDVRTGANVDAADLARPWQSCEI